MPEEVGPEGSGGRQRGATFWDRVLLRLPRVGRRGERPSLGQRMEKAFLKPVEPKEAPPGAGQARSSLEDLEAAKYSDDQERLVGLSMAPLAGLIAIVVATHQLSNNPPAYLPSGQPNPRHLSPALTHEVELVLLALAAAILVSSLLRRRLFTGIAAALYGLAIFNLHWWGFGIPFVFAGAWFLVRAYRVQQAVKAASAEPGAGGSSGPAPPPSKRYTPPTASPRRAPRPPRPRGERDAG
jgi:hypothetical protein